MRMEYPDYYEDFECIAAACTDSCCARWEIDVDEESYYRYLTVQGDFGERIRGCLHTEETVGDDGYPEYEWSFPLTPDRRCPFLNDGDLCDMYTALGHDKLPRTCREFPRGDACVGSYHQVDVALACPEANRLIFEDLERPIRYVEREEPTGIPALDRYCAPVPQTPEEEELSKLSPEEAELLEGLLAERDQLIDLLQDETVLLAERYGTLFALAAEYGVDPSAESHEDLVELIDRMELLDERWSKVYDPVKRAMDTGFPCRFVLEELGTAGTAQGEPRAPGLTGETLVADSGKAQTLQSAAAQSEQELTRFLVYLIFRYYIDGYFENSLTGVYRLLLRGFHMMRLLLAALTPDAFCDPETRRDLYHVWSREVEHSPENFGLIKS